MSVSTIKLFTIGFTKKTAEQFFTKLQQADVKRVLDIRLNNVSQLAGFAKKNDLPYFLKSICDIDYIHEPLLAPTRDILDAFKKRNGEWANYEKDFMRLMESRGIENVLSKELVNGACLLCSEHEPKHCHRRLVAEFLNEKWGSIEINHII